MNRQHTSTAVTTEAAYSDTCSAPIRNVVRSLYEATKPFQHSRWFGIEVGRHESPVGKGRPVHRNTRNNPLPHTWVAKFGRRLYRRAATRSKYMVRDHLAGTQAYFHVTRGDEPIALLGLDCDSDRPDSFPAVAAWYHDSLRQIWPTLEPFVEPGRSFPRKGGGYAWFRVDYTGVKPQTRRVIERLVNRRLKSLLSDAPDGTLFDALKGTTTYEETNPDYDEAYANEDGWRTEHQYCLPALWFPLERVTSRDHPNLRAMAARPLMPGHDGVDLNAWEVWLPERELQKLIKRGWLPENLDFASLRDQYETLSRRASYELEMTFYGIEGLEERSRFWYRREALEPKRRHYGTLITSPCYAAKSGERPDNVEDFLTWLKNPRGQLSLDQFKSILTPNDLEFLARFESGEAEVRRQSRRQRAATTPMEHIDVPVDLPQPDRSRSWAKLLDEDADQHDRYVAAAQIAMRQARGDQEASLGVALGLVELEGGPATGDRHPERIAHCRACIQFVARTFRREYCERVRLDEDAAAGGPVFEQDDIRQMQFDLESRLTKELVDHALRHRRSASVNYTHLATLACLMLKNICTGNIGHVPVKSLDNGMRALGHSISRGRLNDLIIVLVAANMVWPTDNRTEAGRCRRYAISPNAILRPWIAPYAAVGVIEHVHLPPGCDTPPAAVPSLAGREAAVDTAPLSPPPDNGIGTRSQLGYAAVTVDSPMFSICVVQPTRPSSQPPLPTPSDS